MSFVTTKTIEIVNHKNSMRKTTLTQLIKKYGKKKVDLVSSVSITIKGEITTKWFNEGSKMSDIIELMWQNENPIWVIFDDDYFNFYGEDIVAAIEIILHYDKTGLSSLSIYSQKSLLEYHKEMLKNEFTYELNKLTYLNEY